MIMMVTMIMIIIIIIIIIMLTIQSVRIFSYDICMNFGIEECAVLVIKRGKVKHAEGIMLPDDTSRGL